MLAEVLVNAGLMQFRCAETEKYPHVTYFINGGREVTFPGEDSRIIPLLQVSTYDLTPEMSASAVAGCIVQTINNGMHQLVLVNFANGDMLGHTGKTNAIIHAMEITDLQSYRK